MSRFAYVGGRYLRHRAATVSIDDRGFQFGDGAYEVMAVHRGFPVDQVLHLQRLYRSLAELQIAEPVDRRALPVILDRVLSLNRVCEGLLYLQVTRGAARRDHVFPKAATPMLLVTARRVPPVPPVVIRDGVAVISIPDQRWARCDIKSLNLLPNVLGKQQARAAGAFEAWQVDTEGMVTEGASTNAWIVTEDGALMTRPADHAILNGVTRQVILRQATEFGLRLVERPFSLGQAKSATEAFLTSTTSLVLPVTRIDEVPIGDGRPGPVAQGLRARLLLLLNEEIGRQSP
jgi:D-alanine transaminase